MQNIAGRKASDLPDAAKAAIAKGLKQFLDECAERVKDVDPRELETCDALRHRRA